MPKQIYCQGLDSAKACEKLNAKINYILLTR